MFLTITLLHYGLIFYYIIGLLHLKLSKMIKNIIGRYYILSIITSSVPKHPFVYSPFLYIMYINLHNTTKAPLTF